MVYIQEAHPTDLWQMGSNVREGVLYRSPQSDAERNETASSCVRKLGIRIPALVDPIENGTERAYTGWPDRIYIIGRDGHVKFKTAPGPFGFSADALKTELQKLPPAS